MGRNVMVDEPVLSPNARRSLEARYLIKDPGGKPVEGPGEMFRRVASVIAGVEKSYGANENEIESLSSEFYRAMTHTLFLPNSPTLMNAGRSLGMLSACFVLPVQDSVEGIFDSIKHTALIQKAGGGTGFSFDRLRPTGDWIASSGGQTSGRSVSGASSARPRDPSSRGRSAAAPTWA
jgi:ribonucleoside-diphosphate reductase alpha chain